MLRYGIESIAAQSGPGAHLPVKPLNVLLAGIPEEEFESLHPYLEYQELGIMRVLNEPDRTVGSIYFLNSGLASLEVPTSGGTSIEVGLVGKGGFVGIPLICGVQKTLLRTVMQVSGSGYRVKSEDVERMMHSAPHLAVKMRHYALVQGMQVAQMAACNRLHDLQQRLARWLLATADRIGSEIPITQDHLAQLLGTGRASLSVVASRVRKTGVITYARGTIRIHNRIRLEMLSCECYETVRRFHADVGMAG